MTFTPPRGPTKEDDTNLRNARTKVIAGSLLTAALVTGGAMAVTGAASAAESASGTATAATATDDSTSGSTDATPGTAPAAPTGTVDESKSQRSDETLLTGTEAEKATAAALVAYPGATIQRVETDSDGVYGAHLVTADGQVLIVQMDADFAVTGTQERGGPGGGGGHAGDSTTAPGAASTAPADASGSAGA